MLVRKSRLNRLLLILALVMAGSSVAPFARARPPLPRGWVGPHYYWHGRYWHNRYPAYDRNHRRYWRYR